MREGDWVRVSDSNPYLRSLRGKIGAVVGFNPPFVSVRFPGWNEGHDGTSESRYDRGDRECWWVREEHLVVEETYLVEQLLKEYETQERGDLEE